MTDTTSKIVTDALASQIVQNTTLHLNLSQDAIVITEDKVRLILIEHLGRMEARKDWLAPGGVLLTLILTFVTTSFKDFVFKAAVWQAIFVVAGFLVVAWLVKVLLKAWKAPTVEDVTETMKKAGAAGTQDSRKG